MIEYPALMPYVERYAALAMEPLRVRAIMVPGAHVAGYDAPNLDNLLARAVVMDATGDLGLPATPKAYWLPVPLRVLWYSPEGLPLYAVTPFQPEGTSVEDVQYWHKRQQTGRWTGVSSGRMNIAPQNGRWMERRIPLPTRLARAWVADAIGNPETIVRLLAPVRYIGKRRSNGYGEVAEWRVELNDGFAIVKDGRLRRPLPEAAIGLLEGQRPVDDPVPVGWTPPQWNPALFAPGWWAGTEVVDV